MEHEEIDLNRKHNNSRDAKGRFGVKTNKTLKFDRSVLRRQHETIAIVDPNSPSTDVWRPRLDLGVGISLNAHKNWEILDRNKLNSSQDDIDVDYGRIVDLDFDNVYYKQNHKGEFYKQIYGADQNENNEKNEEPYTIAGTNRKGFFVKQKRKQGKKGVKGYHSDDDSNPNKHNKNEENRNKSRSRDSTGSDVDSDVEHEEEKPERIVIVQRHKHGKPKHQPFHGPSKCGLFNCDMCAEEQMMKERHHDTLPRANRTINAVNVDINDL